MDTFTNTITSLLDKHAPLKSVSCPSLSRKPFITPAIRTEKSKRSKLETIYRRTRSPKDLLNFKKQSRTLHKLIATSRQTYYRSLIATNEFHPRILWSTLNSLLSRSIPLSLPSFSSPSALAASFLQFFDDKITALCSKLPPISALNAPNLQPPLPPLPLSSFSPATSDEVRNAILRASDSTCSSDFIPTKLLKSCLDALIIPITALINLSISEGSFPSSFKHALVKPLLKKYNLPHDDLSSYRPISNLNFISKILERVIHNRISSHLQTFSSLTPFQSAYRSFHSTESALLRIQNDILLAINKQKVSALVLLDLSAAFDTIDHSILLSRLSSYYGLSGSALDLVSSYLLNRSQSVTIDSFTTAPSAISTGVPQGSVLGPLLFSLYTSPLSQIFTNTSVSFHLYADDTQLYISFTPDQSDNSLTLLSTTLDSVYTWLTANRLSVNPSKTEYLLIGNPQQRCKIISNSIVFCGNTITPSSSARNLGIIFDSELSYKSHISAICKSSFYQIRQLRQVRASLDLPSATALANSLVSSKLDYCNSLFFGLPKSSLHRLQLVQNSLARAVIPSIKKYHHISPVLHKLHWLPILQRIDYKIALITFKVLLHKQPTYLSDLIIPYIPTRDLRSSDKLLLDTPDIRSKPGRRSFFFAAPTIWNSLSFELRSPQSLDSFRTALKTHLFPELPP